ncbi:peptidyl-alpha-hydroxyglycine alpha-amidating lyase 2 isoform X2 [Xylocopa sonorina]|uniref:peptidyl-alpha-hydroxyglycine alpha-amidating lyase 2 isoform X2 n=1 Tax=Xylocopa sonorina TaxID=1818115 RepID=UPI00403A9406
MHLQHDIACCISVLFILSFVNADFQNYLNLQHRTIHLPDKKFGSKDYSEYSDNDERDKEPLPSQWDQVPMKYRKEYIPKTTVNIEPQDSDELDKNIVWDPDWSHDITFGQITAVSIDPNGNIGIFHRGTRIWGTTTFDNENRFDRNKGPIPINTVILLDKSGNKLLEWGANMFYLPHGLTIDMHGNYWITDVALHQVLKFDAKDITMMKDMAYLFEDYVPKPSLILGEAFQPGNNDKQFCKPTAVAVESNGDFFVSDGYCNSRIIKFDKNGKKILEWGRHWGTREIKYEQTPPHNAFYVPHALALASELNLLFVADRENGRVLSFFANSGDFHKEYKHPTIGTKIYSVAYAKERLYLINGPPDPNANYYIHIRGFILDVNSGDILSQFGPGQDMNWPHDIAVADNGSEIYVVELNIRTAYKFSHNINASMQTGNSMVRTNHHHEPAPLTDSDISNPTGGCLLIMRKRMRWEAERRENFKLSSLLENRRGKSFKIMERRPNPRDFSKLNTEPETSEDEYPENSLTKVI